MVKQKKPVAREAIKPLSIDELEAGLRAMGEGKTDLNAFWDTNIAAFRQTVLFAIRETSDALLSPTITLRWRVELESQLEALIQYIELADGYIARRSLSYVSPALERAPAPFRIH
jgi:hypothetical protein